MALTRRQLRRQRLVGLGLLALLLALIAGVALIDWRILAAWALVARIVWYRLRQEATAWPDS